MGKEGTEERIELQIAEILQRTAVLSQQSEYCWRQGHRQDYTFEILITQSWEIFLYLYRRQSVWGQLAGWKLTIEIASSQAGRRYTGLVWREADRPAGLWTACLRCIKTTNYISWWGNMIQNYLPIFHFYLYQNIFIIIWWTANPQRLKLTVTSPVPLSSLSCSFSLSLGSLDGTTISVQRK